MSMLSLTAQPVLHAFVHENARIGAAHYNKCGFTATNANLEPTFVNFECMDVKGSARGGWAVD